MLNFNNLSGSIWVEEHVILVYQVSIYCLKLHHYKGNLKVECQCAILPLCECEHVLIKFIQNKILFSSNGINQANVLPVNRVPTTIIMTNQLDIGWDAFVIVCTLDSRILEIVYEYHQTSLVAINKILGGMNL